MHNTEMENKALLFAFGELGSEQAFKQHLNTCKACQALVISARTLGACMPLKTAPKTNIALPASAQQPRSWFKLPVFSFRGLVPGAGIAVLVMLVGFTAMQINTVETNALPTVKIDNLEMEVQQMEQDLVDILNDFWF